jgi:hypothetical protein
MNFHPDNPAFRGIDPVENSTTNPVKRQGRHFGLDNRLDLDIYLRRFINRGWIGFFYRKGAKYAKVFILYAFP